MIIGKNRNILPQFTTIPHFVDKFYHLALKIGVGRLLRRIQLISILSGF